MLEMETLMAQEDLLNMIQWNPHQTKKVIIEKSKYDSEIKIISNYRQFQSKISPMFSAIEMKRSN